MADLPLGWGKRHSTMSEHDMKLGGIAATKFASKKNSYDGSDGSVYKTSDQVRDFYINGLEKKGGSSTADNKKSGEEDSASLPDFWSNRQREKDLHSRQMGAFSRQPAQQTQPMTTEANSRNEGDSTETLPPEVALLKIATNTLETMALTFQGKTTIKIPMEERAAFAKAMKQAMDALSKQPSA